MPGNVSDDSTLLAAFDYVSFICIFYELTSFSTNRPTTVVKWQSNVRVIVKPKMSPFCKSRFKVKQYRIGDFSGTYLLFVTYDTV